MRKQRGGYNKKPVYVYKGNILISEYKSLSEASKHLKMDIGNLSRLCRHGSKRPTQFTYTYNRQPEFVVFDVSEKPKKNLWSKLWSWLSGSQV